MTTPPPVIRPHRRGIPFATRVTLLIVCCFAVGLAGGAGAHAVLITPAASTDTMATPQQDWNDGVSSAWTVPLAASDATTAVTTTPEILWTADHVAVLSASGQPTSTVSGFAVSDSRTAPSASWSTEASVGGIGDSAILGRWWGEDLVLMGEILPSGATALPTNIATDISTGSQVVPLPGDILITCSADQHCSAWDAQANRMWEKNIPGTLGSSGALLREEDQHVLVPVYSDTGTAQILDATSGTLTTLDTTSGKASDAFFGGGNLWPTRDGWVAYNSDGSEVLTWDIEGNLLGTQSLGSLNGADTAFVVSPGGTPTSEDYLRWDSAAGSVDGASSVKAADPDASGQCTTISVNGTTTTLPDALVDWVSPSSDAPDTCVFQAFGTVASSIDGDSVVAVLRGLGDDSVTRVVVFDMDSSSIAWVSDPVGAAALIRSDLLVTVSQDGTTMTGWTPGNSTTIATSPPTPSSTEQTPSEAASPQVEVTTHAPQTSPSSATTSPSAEAPVPGAYPGAGGPVPEDATPVTTFQGEGDTRTAVIISPSGNIGCDLSSLGAGCGVQSLLESGKYGSDEVGTRWYIPFAGEGDGVPQIRSQGGAAAYMLTDPQVVSYGDVVYYDTFVCASEENGMTCWDTSTGRGVFVNHDTAIGF